MSVSVGKAIQHLRATTLLGEGAGDGELLGAFVALRDEAAFAALLRRHGPMVLGVCRRILRNGHDAEDAFQAAFLVLARRAAAVAPRDMVGNWLYGVACRTALEAKRMIARRRAREHESRRPSAAPPATDPQGSDLAGLLDEELSRLPDRLRWPVVLCDLEGRTRRDAARQLGVPDGTLSNRLASARRALARRLAARGVTLSATALAVALAPAAAEAVPPLLAAATVRAALSPATSAPPAVAALTQGVLKAMFVAKLKRWLAVLVAIGAFTGLWVGHAALTSGSPTTAAPVQAAAEEPVQQQDVEAKAVLAKAAKAAAAIPAAKDEELRRKVDVLVSIGINQGRAKDLDGAAATFKQALEVAGAIKAEVARAEAQSHIGFYQAHAGLTADARKTHDAIKVTDEKKAREAQDARNRILIEMADHLAKNGDTKEALKVAESIPVRTFKVKRKGEDKETEIRDSMSRDTALKYVVEGQLKAKDVAGALKTARAIESTVVRFWPLRSVVVAYGQAKEKDAAKLFQDWRKEVEADKSGGGNTAYLVASTQAAMGDAAGALTWIDQLASEEERANALLGVSVGLAEYDLAMRPKKGP
jgi:RNA polymerase sigma factor (sigma-70 family)